MYADKFENVGKKRHYIYIYINYPNSFEKILENVNSPITMRKVISIINFISTGKH